MTFVNLLVERVAAGETSAILAALCVIFGLFTAVWNGFKFFTADGDHMIQGWLYLVFSIVGLLVVAVGFATYGFAY